MGKSTTNTGTRRRLEKIQVRGDSAMDTNSVEELEKVESAISAGRETQKRKKYKMEVVDHLLYIPPRTPQRGDGDRDDNTGQKRKRYNGAVQKKRKVTRDGAQGGRSARINNIIDLMEGSQEKSSPKGKESRVKELQAALGREMTMSNIRLDIQEAQSPSFPWNPAGSNAQVDTTGKSDNSQEKDALKRESHLISKEVSKKVSLERTESIISSSIDKHEAFKNADNEASTPKDLGIGNERTTKRSYFNERRTRNGLSKKKKSPVRSIMPFEKCMLSPSEQNETGKEETEESTVALRAVCSPTMLDDFRCILTPVGSAPLLGRSVLRTSGLMPIALLAKYIHSVLGLLESQIIDLRCCGEDLKGLSSFTLQQLSEQVWREPRSLIVLEYELS